MGTLLILWNQTAETKAIHNVVHTLIKFVKFKKREIEITGLTDWVYANSAVKYYYLFASVVHTQGCML